ncbi:MAG: formate dehydrogenase subunit gamma [Gammaproteobacteria bacterium]|nr:formate dehydrogenase subunit gamma [Gammaproteobacteria bacterium]
MIRKLQPALIVQRQSLPEDWLQQLLYPAFLSGNTDDKTSFNPETKIKHALAICCILMFWLSPVQQSFADQQTSQAAVQIKQQTTTVNPRQNPRSAVWRKVREGRQGYSAVSGPESGQLIEASGEVWRRIRNGPLAVYGGWAMLVTAILLVLFYLIRGQVKLTDPKTGIKLLRWSGFERFIHWYTAILFIVLSLTGLSILFGRSLLIPLIGHEAFAIWAIAAKLIHNYSGPLFMAGLFTMIVIWVKDNLPDKYDINWLKAFGGLIGNNHPSAARMNAGEKLWFWLLSLCGILISLTGLILDFPVIEQERMILQVTHLIHLSSAILLLIGALGHIYIGTIGTQGALEGMMNGEVDETWAKQHHDIWYQQETERLAELNKPSSASQAAKRLRALSEKPSESP